jgi:lipid-binding SYLF domain-containing protein
MFKKLSKLVMIVSFCVVGLYAGFKENRMMSTTMEIMQNSHIKIPQKVLQNAKAIVIIPNLKHGSLLFGGSYGHGILTIKNENGWSDPSFVIFRNISFGFQAGLRSTDAIMIFENIRGLDGITDGKATISLTAGAVFGKKGVYVSRKTDGELSADIYLFGRSSGLELNAGSFSSGNLYIDDETNDKYYNSVVNTDILLSGVRQSTKPQVLKFKKLIMEITQ